MAYTINKLAALSGVSIQTLRYYDEIGLLKPAYYGENNYRYYEEAQLLRLQQILFFRELKFQLGDIKRILSDPNFDQLSTLASHREILEKNLNHAKALLQTIDKTIAHLRGKLTMKLEEIFDGFDAEKQSHYEDFLVENGVSKEMINRSKENVKHWDEAAWLAHKKEAAQIYAASVAAINHQLEPGSPEVQEIIKQHYQMTTIFWTPTRETYIGLSQLYCSHPDFVKFYEEIHPDLLAYLVTAMKVYAETAL